MHTKTLTDDRKIGNLLIPNQDPLDIGLYKILKLLSIQKLTQIKRENELHGNCI